MNALPARLCAATGAITGAVAVGLAAAASHAPLPPHRIAMLGAAAQMAGWHALAMVACGLVAERAGRPAVLAGGLFALGTVLFCGGVAAEALTGLHPGPIAPAGGVTLMVAWLSLAIAALRRGPSAGP